MVPSRFPLLPPQPDLGMSSGASATRLPAFPRTICHRAFGSIAAGLMSLVKGCARTSLTTLSFSLVGFPTAHIRASIARCLSSTTNSRALLLARHESAAPRAGAESGPRAAGSGPQPAGPGPRAAESGPRAAGLEPLQAEAEGPRQAGRRSRRR